MNKGAVVNFSGKDKNLTTGKNYKVVAGQGDGTPRNGANGTLGAFLQNESEFIIVDDRGLYRLRSIKNADWTLVKDVESPYRPKRQLKSPIA